MGIETTIYHNTDKQTYHYTIDEVVLNAVFRGRSRHFRKGWGVKKKMYLKTICFKKYQMIQRHNSMRKLQNMLKRKMTRACITQKGPPWYYGFQT